MKRLVNVRHLMGATWYSLAGLKHAWDNEQAFRHEAIVFVILLGVLWWTDKDWSTGLFVLGCWTGVMALELVNSALEKAFDLATTDWNPHVKAGKDMASGAVFLAVLGNIALWGMVFFS